MLLEILVDQDGYTLDGKRSDAINKMIKESMMTFRNKKAAEGMNKLRKSANIKMTTKEFIKLKNYGRDN